MKTLEETIGELQGKLKMSNIEYILPSIVFYYSSMNYAKKTVADQSFKVLDVGCSEGYGIYLMKKLCQNCEFVGIDINSEKVTTAKKIFSNDPNVKFYVGDIVDDRFVSAIFTKYGLFDMVTCFEVFEHLSSNDSVRMLSNLNSLLNNSGLLFISTPNRIVYDANTYTPDHINEQTPKEFISKLEEAGFEIIEVFGSYRISPIFLKAIYMFGLEARKGDYKNNLTFLKRLFRYSLSVILSPNRLYESLLKKLTPQQYILFRLKKSYLTKDYENSALIFVIAQKNNNIVNTP